MTSLANKIIILGVTGGIAAYKTPELVRLLKKEGADVHVVLTRAAQHFVTPLTMQSLSQNPVNTELFDLNQENQMGHIDLADRAHMVVVAPATADFLAKAAHGLADDFLSTLLLVTRAPVLLCPSMNCKMWEHKLTERNLATLKELGHRILEPDEGELACGYTGKGRLCEPEKIFTTIKTITA